VSAACFQQVAEHAGQEAGAKVLECERGPVKQLEDGQPAAESDGRGGEVERIPDERVEMRAVELVAHQPPQHRHRDLRERRAAKCGDFTLREGRDVAGEVQAAVRCKPLEKGLAEVRRGGGPRGAGQPHQDTRCAPTELTAPV